MTRQESNKLLNEAAALIFKVEESLPDDDIIRKCGYRARVEIGNLQNQVRESREENDISKIVYDNPLLNPRYKIS